MLNIKYGNDSSQENSPALVKTIKLLSPKLPTYVELMPWLKSIDESRWYTNFGPLNESLSDKLSELMDNSHVVTVASGTAALELLLEDLDLPTGSRILVPAFTFPATVTAVIRAGLTPVLADVNSKSWHLTPRIADKYLASHQIAGVLPVATLGLPLPSEEWDSFSEATGIPVIFDAAGAFGNQQIPQRIPVAFSMHATKSFACGEGGLVVSRDQKLYKRLRKRSNFGIGGSRKISQRGILSNQKLSEYHAAVGLASLESWQENRLKRIALLDIYYHKLQEFSPEIALQKGLNSNCVSVLSVKAKNALHRKKIEKQLAKKQIEYRRWYTPIINQHPVFENLITCDELIVSQLLGQTTIGLPFHLDIDANDIEKVCKTIGQIES